MADFITSVISMRRLVGLWLESQLDSNSSYEHWNSTQYPEVTLVPFGSFQILSHVRVLLFFLFYFFIEPMILLRIICKQGIFCFCFYFLIGG